jgi:hypothetical protein
LKGIFSLINKERFWGIFMKQDITLRFVYGEYTLKEFRAAKKAFAGRKGVGLYRHIPKKGSDEPRYCVAHVMVSPEDARDIHKLADELVPGAHSYAEVRLKGHFDGRIFVAVPGQRFKVHHRPGHVPYKPDESLSMSAIMRLTTMLPRRIPT